MWLILLLFFASPLIAADARQAQIEEKRHHAILDAYTERKIQPVPWWEAPSILGSQVHARTAMADVGITIASSFVTDMLGNPVGGKARGFAYAGSMGLSMNIDFGQMCGWRGFNLFGSTVWRTGTNLSQRKIDNQFNVAQVFGSQTVKLNELYFLQTLYHDRLAFKAGRLNAGNDFFASPFYGQYVNNAFDGNPVSIFFNTAFSSYPNATWGAYFRALPFKWLLARFGVYNANTNIQKDKYHGTNFTFKNTNGLIWITEWSALVNQGENDHGMPGNYKLGFYYQTGTVNLMRGGTTRGDPSFYFLFDQMIYRKGGPKSEIGLTPFIAMIFVPKDRNRFPFFYTTGLVYQGPFPSRPDDSVSLGMVYGKYSTDLTTGQNFEAVLEFNYWVQINPWFTIIPDIQYVIHPKGLNTKNSFVIGTQINVILW